MLEEKNQTVFHRLQEKAIANHTVHLINKIRKINLPLEVHNHLLKFINCYLASEIIFQPQNDKIGEITLQTQGVNQKTAFLAYAIVFIDKGVEYFYPIVFSVLLKIFQLHEFLIGQLKDCYLTKICLLIVHSSREIQVESLSLLNSITYYSQINLDFLLKEGYLLDKLRQRLQIQLAINDQNNKNSIELIGYILCNSLLTEKAVLKKVCLKHHIWEIVYQSLHPSQKLFPLIMAMPYFFTLNGHKNFQNYLIPYLEALIMFDWNTCSYSKSINQCLRQLIFEAGEYWQEHQKIELLKIYQHCGFLVHFQDLCQPQDLQKVRNEKMS